MDFKMPTDLLQKVVYCLDISIKKQYKNNKYMYMSGVKYKNSCQV